MAGYGAPTVDSSRLQVGWQSRAGGGHGSFSAWPFLPRKGTLEVRVAMVSPTIGQQEANFACWIDK